MKLRFGAFSDLHSSLEGVEERGYSCRTLEDMNRGMARFADAGVSFVVCLGDNTQPAYSNAEQYDQMKSIVEQWNSYGVPVYMVWGNHEFQQLSYKQVLQLCQTDKGYYSFDIGDIRFIVLDTNVRPDGIHFSEDNFDWRYSIVPEEQLNWLQNVLYDKKRTFILTHGNLWFDQNDEHAKWYQVINYEAVLNILKESGCVDTVIQGHHHTFWNGIYRGIRFLNIPSPERSPAYTDRDFPIIEITDDAVFYNGEPLT